MVTIDQLLYTTVHYGASDLHIKAESPPIIRIHGDLIQLDMEPLDVTTARQLSLAVLSEAQRSRFDEELELDFAYEIPGLARFRGNVYQQRGNVQSAFRVIPLRIQSMEELGLPSVCRYFAERPRGLVLVTGPAGSGKSTTQAAMIDYINHNYPLHIVTVEDPLEFIHEDNMALINQRELDTDTLSFANALKFVLRQDPDVILIGEMRDLETIHLAITAAETGHLVFGTLHTTDAVQTIDRVIDVFPTHQQQQVRMQMAVNLVGVISQTLVKRADGTGRVAAFETLVAISAVRNLIRENKSYQITSLIQTGQRHGMQSLDQALADLYNNHIITYQDGLERSANPREYMALVNEIPPDAPQPPGAT